MDQLDQKTDQVARTHGETKRYHHGDLRREILEVSDKILDTEGASGLVLRKIAERIGVSASAPFKHFKSRAELLDTLAVHGFLELRMNMEQTASRSDISDPKELLLELGRTYFRFGENRRNMFRHMFERPILDHFALSPLGIGLNTGLPSAVKIVGEYLTNGTNDPLRLEEIELTTMMLWSLFHGFTLLLTDRSLEFDRFDAKTKEAFFDQTLIRFLTSLQKSRGHSLERQKTQET